MPSASRAYDDVNVNDTIRRLNACVKQRQIKQQEIAEAANLEKSKLSRWLNGRSSWSSIGEQNYGRILDVVADRNLFSQSGYERPVAAKLQDIAFHGMAMFLGLGAGDIDDARENLVGTYLGWRHSYYAPPDILMGKVDIVYEEDSHCLRTYEHFCVPAGVMGENSNKIDFKRVGYIWPTRHNMYVMISEKVGHRDIQIAFLNKSLVHAKTLDKGAMETVEGIVLDWQGPDAYLTKLFLQKRSKPLPESEIGLKTEKDVPKPVLAKLQERFQGPHLFLRVYK